MAKVGVLRVLNEDPWKAELVEEIDVPKGVDPFEKLSDVLAKYVVDGYECYDYGAASIQLCIKKTKDHLAKIMIGLWFEQIPEGCLSDG